MAAAVMALEVVGALLVAAGCGTLAAAAVGGVVGVGVGLLSAAFVVLVAAWWAARQTA